MRLLRRQFLFQQDHFGGERFQGALALQAGLPEVRTPVKETYYRAKETYYKAEETYYKAGETYYKAKET